MVKRFYNVIRNNQQNGIGSTEAPLILEGNEIVNNSQNGIILARWSFLSL